MNILARLKQILRTGQYRLSVTDWMAVELAIEEYIKNHDTKNNTR